MLTVRNRHDTLLTVPPQPPGDTQMPSTHP